MSTLVGRYTGRFDSIFPTFSNPILNLNFYVNVDLKLTYLSNINKIFSKIVPSFYNNAD